MQDAFERNGLLNDTRTRILQAAAEVFADSGFERATIRAICSRASVNVAAINYHFRDKENLYMEVLKYSKALAFEKYPHGLGTTKNDPPEIRLRAFIHAFISRIFDEDVSTLFSRLMSREYIEPTGAFDMIVEEAMRPTVVFLSKIIRELLGRRAPTMRIHMCCASVISQCHFFFYARHALARLFPQQKLGRTEIEKIADHITVFSLSALQNFQETMKGDKV